MRIDLLSFTWDDANLCKQSEHEATAMLFLRSRVVFLTVLMSSLSASAADFRLNLPLAQKLADILSTDSTYLVPNIPPRSQGLPSAVYSSNKWIPIRPEERGDTELKNGDSTSIDASSVFEVSGGTQVSAVRWFGVAANANDAASASMLFPDAHSIEMIEDKIIDKLSQSQEVLNGCERNEQMMVVTKSYEGTPKITLRRKAEIKSESFATIKAKIADASIDVGFVNDDVIQYSLKKPIIFAFEVSKVICDVKKMRLKISGAIQLARLSNTQYAASLNEGGNAFAYAKAPSQGTRVVGGSLEYPNKNIVDNAIDSKNQSILVAAVKAAGLIDTLKSDGPFTIFAPTNKAFEKLPIGTVDSLVMPQNKSTLTSILNYHVVKGKITTADMISMIKSSGGKAKLKTVEGTDLTITLMGKGINITDAKGDVAHVTEKDVFQSNGVVHVIDSVMLPGG